MTKQRVNLYVDGQLWREFRAACVRRGKSASEAVDILMNDQMIAWAAEDEAKRRGVKIEPPRDDPDA